MLLAQLERSFSRFTTFYGTQHSGRKLNWLYHMSKGELVTNCFKNRYTLQVSQCSVTAAQWVVAAASRASTASQ